MSQTKMSKNWSKNWYFYQYWKYLEKISTSEGNFKWTFQQEAFGYLNWKETAEKMIQNVFHNYLSCINIVSWTKLRNRFSQARVQAAQTSCLRDDWLVSSLPTKKKCQYLSIVVSCAAYNSNLMKMFVVITANVMIPTSISNHSVAMDFVTMDSFCCYYQIQMFFVP